MTVKVELVPTVEEKHEAASLVKQYAENVSRLYQVPMCELIETVKTDVLVDWGNG
jgi:hypothetical protein